MIEHRPIRAAGIALLWQAFQMGGVKAIYLIRTLVLARLLLPDDFGLIAIALTAVGFLFNITNFGMVPALVQGKNVQDANYDAAWTLDFFRTLFLAIVTIISAPLIADVFGEPRAVPIIQVLALRPFIESMTSIRMATLSRNLMFRPLALLYIIEAIVNTTVSISLATTWGVWALVAGALSGIIAIVVSSYFLAPYRPKLSFDWKALQPLIHFGRWIFATNIIVIISGYVLRVIITRQFGSAGLGIYVLATQLAFIPGEAASELVGSVAFPLFARLQNNIPQATRVFRALFGGLAAVLYPVCALIMVLAPSLVQDILGAQWAGTEDVIQILAIVVMIGIFGDVAVALFKGFGQPYRITFLEVIQSTTTVIFVWVLSQKFGLTGVALAWLPTIALSQVISSLFLKKILLQPFQGIYKQLLAIMASTLICLVTAAVTRNFIPGVVGFIAAGTLGMISAGLSLWLADHIYGLGFARNLAVLFPRVAVFFGLPTIGEQ